VTPLYLLSYDGFGGNFSLGGNDYLYEEPSLKSDLYKLLFGVMPEEPGGG